MKQMKQKTEFLSYTTIVLQLKELKGKWRFNAFWTDFVG